MTEPGAKGLRIAKFNDDEGGVSCWEDMMGAVEALEEDKSDRYKTVIIDTIDVAFQQCFDYVCKLKGVNHPSEINGGKGDWGGTTARITKTFIEAIHRIMRTKRGVCFTSHYKQLRLETRNGTEYQQVSPTISGTAGELVKGLVDYIFFVESCQRIPGLWDEPGEEPRVLICQGDDTVIAGSRPSPFIRVFPKYLPCNVEGTYNTIEQAFNGQYEGIDPTRVVPSRTNADAVADLMSKNRTKSISPKA